MNVTLRQLRAFCALAHTSSFTEAAGSLHVTQSALSGLIKELEQIWRAAVHRSTRKVQLSEAGREFYPGHQNFARLGRRAGRHGRPQSPQARRGAHCRAAVVVLHGAAGRHGYAKRVCPDIQVRLLDSMVESAAPR